MTEQEIKDKILLLRLEFGDTDDSYMILQEAEYIQLIKSYGENDNILRRQVGNTLMCKLALTSVRERVGQEERYGNNAFENYLAYLKLKLKDPAFGNISPLSYFGGTYRTDAEYYDTNPDFTWTPYYQGSSTGYPTWKGLRVYTMNGNIIEPYQSGNPYRGYTQDVLR